MREQIAALADTWWTLVAYHNSKRELGKTLSLARDDIPARLRALGEKRTIAGAGVKELSANLKDSEIPEALQQLGISLPSKDTLDFVACTNMLSVGVDVQRLGLMLVNGQPKTVSEYIQASSRVGRDGRRSRRRSRCRSGRTRCRRQCLGGRRQRRQLRARGRCRLGLGGVRRRRGRWRGCGCAEIAVPLDDVHPDQQREGDPQVNTRVVHLRQFLSGGGRGRAASRARGRSRRGSRDGSVRCDAGQATCRARARG